MWGVGPVWQRRAVSVLRLSTDMLPETERASWFADEMGARLTSARAGVLPDEDRLFRVEWMHAQLPRTVVGRVQLAGVYVERTPTCLADGDDDFTYFMPLRWGARWRQNGHAEAVRAGGGMLIAHARPVESWWTRAEVGLIRLPRAALPLHHPDALAGQAQAAGAPALRLLRAYYRSVWRMVAAGQVPPAASERHLAELVAAAIAPLERPTLGARQARLQARVAAVREIVARRFAEPGLDMAEVAAGVGLSARSCYKALESVEVSFTDLLAAVRLDRAREILWRQPHLGVLEVALTVGFTDLSHFNRRFRARFGMTPSEARAGR